jgi:hypothetical protein
VSSGLSGNPAEGRHRHSERPALRSGSIVASDADGKREHLDDPEHFTRQAALLIASLHRRASERGKR